MSTPVRTTGHRLHGAFASALIEAFRSEDTYGTVRGLARRSLSELGLRTPPFCPFQAAELLGIRVRYQDIADEGYCCTLEDLDEDVDFEERHGDTPSEVPSGNRTVIVLREQTGKEHTSAHLRQRFTMAHELGHLVLRSGIIEHHPHFTFRKDDREEEAFCNAFASEFLLPSPLLLTELRTSGVNAETLIKLSRCYNVSLQSVLVKTIFLFGDLIAIGTYTRRGSRIAQSFATPVKHRCLFENNIVRAVSQQAFRSDGTLTDAVELCEMSSRGRWILRTTRIHDGERVMTIMHRHNLPEALSDYFHFRSPSLLEFKSTLPAALANYSRSVSECAWRRSRAGDPKIKP